MTTTDKNQSLQETSEKISWDEFAQREMKTTGEPDEAAIIIKPDDIYRDTYFISDRHTYVILNESIAKTYPQNKWQNFVYNQKSADAMLKNQSHILQLFSQYSKKPTGNNHTIEYSDSNVIDKNLPEQSTSSTGTEVEKEQQVVQITNDGEVIKKAMRFMTKGFDEDFALFLENSHVKEDIQSVRKEIKSIQEMINNTYKNLTGFESADIVC